MGNKELDRLGAAERAHLAACEGSTLEEYRRAAKEYIAAHEQCTREDLQEFVKDCPF
ncbi:hypothetical protein N5079_04930 [Planotetraspora sp. A-T 1434]|uniref:hypothetical protein n=1 Tax=Planotetraspora sp. A-T 1434 TaxID=2979219 RepID=UPI0021C00F73|nr:hypothetical protein [Planotetraspora sp. A-T 1434]MCT9929561.1 hypothetical protein [Planotetraspora sp. A-T 1434]